MALYYETAAILSSLDAQGGSLKSRIFSRKDLKTPAAQVYALAVESCKWSGVLKEVIEGAELLRIERKLTPVLALLLAHDHLLSKGGVALPASHGLAQTVQRHKARLAAELTRARLRKKCATLEALRELIEEEAARRRGPLHPRWIRVNVLRSRLDKQLSGTLKGYERVDCLKPILEGRRKVVYVDEHIPDLVAVAPGKDFTRTEAYKRGEIILQDKASCFPALLLDVKAEGDVIDACAAPGNKTTQLGAMVGVGGAEGKFKIHAFERDKGRAETLERMVRQAGSDSFTVLHGGQDFTKIDPMDGAYKNVVALLLDPSCSGTGIVQRDEAPELHLAAHPDGNGRAPATKRDKTGVRGSSGRKRKRGHEEPYSQPTPVDDKGETNVLARQKVLSARIDALAAFQLAVIVHAFCFPAARRITYSTCSTHAGENEHVVVKALASDVARRRGWRVLRREEQVEGLRTWPVRGLVEACGGDEVVAGACIRAERGDGRGTMGFFVAGFVRECGGRHGSVDDCNETESERDSEDEDQDDWRGFED